MFTPASPQPKRLAFVPEPTTGPPIGSGGEFLAASVGGGAVVVAAAQRLTGAVGGWWGRSVA